eukprot:CAMPEP_0174275250 /NCGR_PEP_ID=MMETSP0439-20130205/59722_1 /TAXON_ID=0 /ORGANISM="Stereomyxa ramosa, Strain Chinc5" /LENGTH=905 /DNA_ID=CAMNT_0015367335 /DNA_START=912 /DNA_END=3629 /DNA_ORIENTATION=-
MFFFSLRGMGLDEQIQEKQTTNRNHNPIFHLILDLYVSHIAPDVGKDIVVDGDLVVIIHSPDTDLELVGFFSGKVEIQTTEGGSIQTLTIEDKSISGSFPVYPFGPILKYTNLGQINLVNETIIGDLELESQIITQSGPFTVHGTLKITQRFPSIVSNFSGRGNVELIYVELTNSGNVIDGLELDVDDTYVEIVSISSQFEIGDSYIGPNATVFITGYNITLTGVLLGSGSLIINCDYFYANDSDSEDWTGSLTIETGTLVLSSGIIAGDTIIMSDARLVGKGRLDTVVVYGTLLIIPFSVSVGELLIANLTLREGSVTDVRYQVDSLGSTDPIVVDNININNAATLTVSFDGRISSSSVDRELTFFDKLTENVVSGDFESHPEGTRLNAETEGDSVAMISYRLGDGDNDIGIFISGTGGGSGTNGDVGLIIGIALGSVIGISLLLCCVLVVILLFVYFYYVSHKTKYIEKGKLMGLPSELQRIEWSELTIKEELGQGAFGVVKKAEWRRVEVAVKEIKLGSALVEESDGLQDLLEEAKMMSKAGKHPNVLAIMGIVHDEKRVALVTEFCAGGSLESMLQSNKDISDVAKLRMAVGAATGLLHLHQNGIVHRDIAARNMLLNETGRVLVSDFGLARTKGLAEENKTESTIGPVRYMAPESIVDRIYSEASDAFSFGVLLWEIDTRKQPWRGVNVVNVITGVTIKGERLPLEMVKLTVFKQIMKKCWATNPEHRMIFDDIQQKLHREYLRQKMRSSEVFSSDPSDLPVINPLPFSDSSSSNDDSDGEFANMIADTYADISSHGYYHTVTVDQEQKNKEKRNGKQKKKKDMVHLTSSDHSSSLEKNMEELQSQNSREPLINKKQMKKHDSLPHTSSANNAEIEMEYATIGDTNQEFLSNADDVFDNL